RVATAVMRRPVIFGGSVVVLLLLLGAPFLNIRFGLPDDRVLPTTMSSRQVQDSIRTNFTSEEAGALTAVLPGVNATARAADIDQYANTVSKVPGVARVDATTGSYLNGQRAPLPPNPALTARLSGPNATLLSVVPSVEPNSAAGEQVVKDIR